MNGRNVYTAIYKLRPKTCVTFSHLVAVIIIPNKLQSKVMSFITRLRQNGDEVWKYSDN